MSDAKFEVCACKKVGVMPGHTDRQADSSLHIIKMVGPVSGCIGAAKILPGQQIP